MATIIPVAGGKGGVGKSVLSLNLSVTLASQCKSVLLCDLDFGGANLHTMLGLKNNQSGLGHFITKQETSMQALVQATGIPHLHFIAGDCLFPGVANMDFFTKQKIIREICKLQYDYIILDLGAGSTHNIVDFFIITHDGLLVVTPELTSVLNAYSFLKSSVYRFCYRQFAPNSAGRTILKNSILQRLEGKDFSFAQILKVIEDAIPNEGMRVLTEMQKFCPRVIMNMGRNEQNIEMGVRLQHLVQNKLSINIEYIGYIPYDECVQYAIAQRQAASVLYPKSLFAQSLVPVATRLVSTSARTKPVLQDASEDFADIVREFYAKHSQDG